MGATENFRRQHDEARALVRHIQELSLNAEARGTEIRVELAKLRGILKVHLTMEDRSLYPTLLQHKDPKIAALARRFSDEIGGVTSAFLDFTKSWAEPGTIEKLPEKFRGELNAVIKVLALRMDREDKELYPLLEATGKT